MADVESKRNCPLCAEPIRAEAIRCRHCGAELIDDEMRDLIRRYASASTEERIAIIRALPEARLEEFKRVWKVTDTSKMPHRPANTAEQPSQSSGTAGSFRKGELWGTLIVIAGLLIGFLVESGCGFGALVMLIGLAIFVAGRFQR